MTDDGISLAVGGTAVGAICGVVGAWIKARFSKTQVEPNPLPVETKAKPEYVTKEAFERHVEENAREHESLYSRMNRNDRETSEIKGMLAGIRDDVTMIKDKLLKTRTR